MNDTDETENEKINVKYNLYPVQLASVIYRNNSVKNDECNGSMHVHVQRTTPLVLYFN